MDIMGLIVNVLLFASPLIIVAMGGLFSERSGVVNIGLEGLMIVGAFTTTATSLLLQDAGVSFIVSVLIGMGLSVVAGGLFSLIHAYASISLRANQTISGVALNMLALGTTMYLTQIIFKAKETEPIGIGQNAASFLIPGLGDIPVIGALFDWRVILVLLVVIMTWYVMYRLPFGLRLRACGEHPSAADSMGINVIKMRYQAVFISGMLAGVGGALQMLAFAGKFAPYTINGAGFMALAILVFGQWRPFSVMTAGLFFGLLRVIGVTGSSLFPGLAIPEQLYFALPYIFVIVALILFSRNATAPKALGTPYDKSMR
ncbi:MAG: ABC transporter permease [Culicoidibacterales bacterium]